jgi:hypothetical protein
MVFAGGMSSEPAAAAQQAPMPPSVRQSNGLTLDEQLLDVAKQDPAFGGMFFDGEGRLTMYVLQSTLAAQDGFSRLAGLSVGVESAFRGHHMMDAAATQRMNVLPAQYSFLDLYGWHEAVKSDVLELPGVVLTDIAEDQNRLRVGVERADVAAQVTERLRWRGVPAEAVSIELTTPIRRLATVRNKFRPLMGGLQINFEFYVCTLGFVAVREGVPGMVTNSHCTRGQGGNNNTVFYQPLALDNTYRIGIETTDPAYFSGGACPSGRRCRYSDTAFARLPHPSGPGLVITRGIIAKPVTLNGLSVTTGRFRITSENSTPVLNETLNKVGRTTGWTQGKVVLTCINTNVSGTRITQLCQDIVKAKVAGGDSGSPVFRITNRPSADDVRLYGVLWGGGTLSGHGTVFVFSALGKRNMQRSAEMGTLTTCAGGFSC